jgi:YTV
MIQLPKLMILAVAVLLATQNMAAAGRHHRRGYGGCGSDCGGCAANCQVTYQTVERTIMVPQMFTDYRTVNETQCRTEERQYNYTAYRRVPETRTVEYQYTVPTFETRTREVAYTVCKQVMETQQRQYTVMVPQTETREATRRVCRMVAETRTRTVCEDRGGYQDVPQTYTVGCGDCAQTCTRMCRVWVPNMQTREVQYTVMCPKVEEVPYQYAVTVCHPETRTQNYQVCRYVPEQQTRQVQYSVCVPQQRTGTREVTTCRVVPEQMTATRTIQVPYTVQRQVPVQVCRMVPKTITCQVPVQVPCESPPPCCAANDAGRGAPGDAVTDRGADNRSVDNRNDNRGNDNRGNDNRYATRSGVFGFASWFRRWR